MRSALAIIALAIGIGAGAGLLFSPDQPTPQEAPTAPTAPYVSDYEIVYLGVQTCGPCRYWREDIYPTWEETDVAEHVIVTQLHHGGFRDFDRGRQKGYRWLVDELQSTGRFRATPTFVVIKDESILRVGTGMKGWEASVRFIERRLPRHVTASISA